MSQVKIQGNASGTGAFTIAAPNSNTDRTLTLPDATGTFLTTATAGVPINGPAFSAYASSTTSLTNNTYIKVRFQTEEFDTNSAYDNVTNFRFQPTVAGYYQLTACINILTTGFAIVSFYKNGSEFKRGTQLHVATSVNVQPNSTALIYLNGSTDYVEVYAYQNSGGSVNVGANAPETYFQGAMVRAA